MRPKSQGIRIFLASFSAHINLPGSFQFHDTIKKSFSDACILTASTILPWRPSWEDTSLYLTAMIHQLEKPSSHQQAQITGHQALSGILYGLHQSPWQISFNQSIMLASLSRIDLEKSIYLTYV